MPHRRGRIVQVLQDIQHQYQVEMFLGNIRLVERANVDPVPVGGVFRDQMSERFHALNRAELGERIKEESISAPDIQNRLYAVPTIETGDLGNEQSFPCPPPPVAFVQHPIGPSIGVVQLYCWSPAGRVVAPITLSTT